MTRGKWTLCHIDPNYVHMDWEIKSLCIVGWSIRKQAHDT